MLAVLHRTALGRGPAHFRQLFPRAALHAGVCHCFQLVSSFDHTAPDYVYRSIWDMVRIYHILPSPVVAACSMSEFQRRIQNILVSLVTGGHTI
eukprot:800233-Karenia_brevis.AAC.1